MSSRPNVLLIVLDTTRADFFSSYGYDRPTTPKIDALTADAVLFTRAFATSFWTLPSHASLFTGLYPTEAGATSETNFLPAEASTIAERLRDGGYRTYAAVANPWVTAERGLAQGFEEFVETWREKRPPVQRAVRWIDGHAESGAPFFIFLNFNLPHLPYVPPPAVRATFSSEPWPEERVDRVTHIHGLWGYLAGAVRLDETDFRIMRDLYAAEVHLTDRLVGRVLSALEASGALDETLVIVTSDHGENIGDHGLIDHALSMYDSTIRVPLLVRFPERFRPGSVDERLVSLIDLFPTILDIAGLAGGTERSKIQEASLCSERRRDRAFVAAENDRPVNAVGLLRRRHPAVDVEAIDYPIRMIRTDRHKLIWHVDRGVELYDIAADPEELAEIAERDPEVRERLLADLQEWMAGLAGPESITPFESGDEEALEALRSLGYVE